MIRLQWLALVFFMSLTARETLSSEPLTYTINTKKWSHILDDHFISVTINPTDLLQGKAFGLGMNSTITILKGLSPAYVRIGSIDTGKYTFKRSRHSNDVARKEDEFIVTESHWVVLNEVAQSAGLDVIVCLNAAHRNGANKKWDTRNSLELISFSDSKGYNLTFQLGYEIQKNSGISGHQFGKDLNRLRTILNAFPRYQHSKLIGPDIKMLHRKEEVEFITDLLMEAGTTLDAVTWHPRWPQPSKMKVSDVSDLGYEFPSDYLEWDKSQLNRVIQRSILRNPIWIGEPKTESTGTFAEGLLWARRLVLAAKLGIEVVMKQPSLMDISHPKPEYWIAFLHKRLLGRAVLETRATNNHTDVAVITHCTNSFFWVEKPDKGLDGSITIYAVNMGGKEHKVHMKGSWSGKSQLMFQYLLTSGSDPDSVFSQMTYLNGEPLMMTDDGNLPEIMPRIRKVDRGVVFKLPPYSVGFWIIPDARVKICQVQPASAHAATAADLSYSNVKKNSARSIQNARSMNQLIVDKLKNPLSDSEEEIYDDSIFDDDSLEKEFFHESRESPQSPRRIRQVTVEDIGQELKQKIREIREMLEKKGGVSYENGKAYPSETLRAAEEKITSLTDELGTATRMSNQEEEFGRFLHRAGLNQDFGALMMNERMSGLQDFRRSANSKNAWSQIPKIPNHYDPTLAKIRRFRRAVSYPEDDYEEESPESYSFEEETATEDRPSRKTFNRKRSFRLSEDSNESDHPTISSKSPSLRTVEERYKTYAYNRGQDGKTKLGDLRKMKTEESEEPKKSSSKKESVLRDDLQQEILMKEVEVLQKTEEAMANLINNHKKRRQTIEEIILHEISDIKEDRLTALEDMRQQKEIAEERNKYFEDVSDEHEIPSKMRRSVLDVLQSNVESDSSGVIKRSIQDKDGNVNNLFENSHEEKKLKIVKRSLDSSKERKLRKRKLKKSARVGDYNSGEMGSKHIRRSRSERLERMKNFIQSRERIRDRNASRRRKFRQDSRKLESDESKEEPNEILGTFKTDFFVKSEETVPKVTPKLVEVPEKKTHQTQVKQKETEAVAHGEGKTKQIKKEERRAEESRSSSNNTSVGDGNGNNRSEAQKSRAKVLEEKPEKSYYENPTNGKTTKSEERKPAEKTKSEERTEYVPLKVDKDRGLNVLKRISNLVENMSTRERTRSKNPSLDLDDLSEEFYSDGLSKMNKKRPRRSHHEDKTSEDAVPETTVLDSGEDSAPQDPKTLRKEMRLRKLHDRLNRRKKLVEEKVDDHKDKPEKGHKSKIKTRLHSKLHKEALTESRANPDRAEAASKLEEAVDDHDVPPNMHEIQNELVEQKINLDSSNSFNDQYATALENVTLESTTTADKDSDRDQKMDDAGASGKENASKESQQNANIEFVENTTFDSLDTKVRPTDRVQIKQQNSLDVQTPVLLIPELSDELIVSPVVADVNKYSLLPDETLPIDKEQITKDLNANFPEDIPELEKETNSEINGGSPEEINVNSAADRGKVYRNAESSGEDGSKLLKSKKVEELSPQAEIVESVNSLSSNDRNVGFKPEIANEEEEELLQSAKAVGETEIPATIRHQSTMNFPLQVPEIKVADIEDAAPDDENADELKKFATVRESYIYQMPHSQQQKKEEAEETVSKDAFEESERSESTAVESISGKSFPSTVEGRTDSDLTDQLQNGLFEEAQEDSLHEPENFEVHEKQPALLRKRRGILDPRVLPPEERIRNFKRVMHRRYLPFKEENEVPEVPVSNKGDDLWKMAGSTVKAVFNEVIPEAYGKTKNKIENLGIAEYFKEFGKIVEQMKNLDRIFANIGQAAVRNYIKGSEDEKGDYIQVIDKRHRSRRQAEMMESNAETFSEGGDPGKPEALPRNDNISTSTDGDSSRLTEASDLKPTASPDADEANGKNETTKTGERAVQVDKKSKVKGLKNYIKDGPNDLIRNIFLMDSNPGIVEVTKSTPTAEPTQNVPLQPFKSRYSTPQKRNFVRNSFYEKQNLKEHFGESNQTFLARRNNDVEAKLHATYKFTPWMKTTKDFINQALTTLQRQRELSEMIARESMNDLVKREIAKRVIGKREAPKLKSKRQILPVYQMPSSRKREIYAKAEENESKQMAHLQPGVYIVPTEEMKNLRSEQILKEAPSTKPGLPNMVTLNIYYDKKKIRDWEVSGEELDDSSEGKIHPDRIGYYHLPKVPWNPIPTSYPDPGFLPPMHEVAIENRYLAPIQELSAVPTEMKIQESPSTRVVQYSEHFPNRIGPSERGFSGSQQPLYDSIFYPNIVPVGHQKGDWTDFKSRPKSPLEFNSLGHHPTGDSGWSVQFQPVKKKILRNRQPMRHLERQLRPYQEKKRSVGNHKQISNFSEMPLPLLKFLSTQKQEKESHEVSKVVEEGSHESESLEKLFAENRRRAREKEAKQGKGKEKEMEPEEPETKAKRRRRDLSDTDAYIIDFDDRDLIPEWFGTIQELDNSLRFPSSDIHGWPGIPLYDDEIKLLRDEEVEVHRFRRNTGNEENDRDPAKPVLKNINGEASSLEVPEVKSEPSPLSNGTTAKNDQAGGSDDAVTHFFKYAYDSLIQMMKGMTDFI